MMKGIVAFILLLGCVASVQAAHHAVLVAGSSEFYNYRHQTDIAHAYNILIKHHVPAENIIVMMYDDVASSGENPFPGQLFNKPTKKGVKGFDVYAAVKDHIDYKGEDVTSENFLNIITGNATGMKGIGTGRVLTSTEDDDVFINFSDHGGTDIMCFPADEDYLHKEDLIAAFKTMQQKKMYGKMVFYLEACESGSMFNKVLTTDLNIYATTAANPDESSYGWYCDPDDMVNGKEIGSCLGDHYSISWMEDADTLNDTVTETLNAQYLKVKKLTNDSHVMQYGNIKPYADLQVLEFEGNTDEPAVADTDSDSETDDSVEPEPAEAPAQGRGVAMADAKLMSLERRYALASKAGEGERARKLGQQLQDEIALRAKVDAIFEKLAHVAGARQARRMLTSPATAFPESAARTACYRQLLDTFFSTCGRSDYSIKYLRVLSNLCAHTVAHRSSSVKQLVNTVTATCQA